MKKIWWILLIIMISGCQKQATYWCGYGEFGGHIEATDPKYCEEDLEKIEKYKPLCQELILGSEHSWEEACSMVLQDPEVICTHNLPRLGIELTGEECYEKLRDIDYCESREDCCKKYGEEFSCKWDCFSNVCTVMKIV